MTFPAVPLDFKTEINLGGTWTDITSYVNMGHGAIGVSRGHPDESTQTPASQSGITVANTDFRFTSTNPTGPYYPNLQRNTPLRHSLAGQAAALRMEDDTTSFASMPASGVLPSGAVDTDIRIDMSLSGYSPCTLASWWGSSERAWIVRLNSDGTIYFCWTTDGTPGTLQTVQSTQPVPLGPIVLRVTFTHSANTVTCYTAPSGSITGASWTQLGAAGGTGASTTIFASTAVASVGYNSTAANIDFPGINGLTGRVSDMLVMLGIGGSIKAQAAFSSQSPGATSWTDGQGNTWTVSGSATIDQRSYRYHGEAAGWPQKWDPTATDVVANVSVSGQIRRIAQRQKPLYSVMYRTISSKTGSLAPAAYWPCEDSSGATLIAAPLPGGITGRIIPGASSTVTLAADSSFACSNSLPQMNGGMLVLPVADYTDTGTMIVRFLLKLPTSLSSSVPGGQQAAIMRIDTAGSGTPSGGQWTGPLYITYEPDIQALDLLGSLGSGGSVSPVLTGITVPMGIPVMVSVELVQSGGNVVPTIRFMTLAGATTSATGTAFAGGTGRITQVVPGLFGDYPGWSSPGATAAGHIYVQSAFENLSNLAGPLAAWAGETAGTRFARVCAENNLRSRIWGYPATSAAMGPQPIDTLANVLQQCPDADRGIMYEPSECLGLGYRTLASMVNQAAALTIAYGQLAAQDDTTALGETEDDQNTLNDVTVTNTDGSSARQYLASGVMSVQEPPNGAGTCDQQIPVNVASDTQLNDEAGWILNTGTVNQPRYPSVKIDLATSDATIRALWWQVLGLRLGDRIVITTPPGMLPPGNIDQLVQGSKENFYTKILNFDWACIPSLPYSTMIFDDPSYGRFDTDGSVLHGAEGSGVTTIFVDTTGPSGIPWTANSVLFTTAGTFSFIPPTGITSVVAQAWAGGAGGGGSPGATNKGGGGGGGEYASEPALAVTPGNSYTVTVGAAGAASGSGTGGTGGNSTIAGDSVTVTAHGGTGGTSSGGAGAPGSGSANTTHFSGGAGGTTPSSADGGGGGGGSGGTAGAGSAGTNATTSAGAAGAAAVTGGGPGGNGGNAGHGGIAPATGPGGGGGGAGGNTGGNSGAGAAGQVLISWTSLDFPFDIIVGGEVMQVTAIQGQSGTQAFTVVRSVNGVVKSHSAGEDVRLYPTPIFALY